MLKDFYSPNDFEGSDRARIQAAVDEAARTGVNVVRIPRVNAAADSLLWTIDEPILLPSDITVFLDSCHLRMADGVRCQMFRNSNAYTPLGNTPEGKQFNIRILGTGDALLDGGKENGLNEFTSDKNGLPNIYHNLTIYLHNVSGFVLDGFTVRNQRWWGMAMMYADNGRISNLHFELTQVDSYAAWRNQDGIDLRIGCHNILIENISGETGDDCIALTALNKADQMIPGLSGDIHDVIIQNVRAFSHMCAIIRLLAQQGNRVQHITIRDIFDTSTPIQTSKVQMALRIGEDHYYHTPEERGHAGDISDISVENVHTRALTAIHLEMAVKNFHARNIFIHHDAHHALTIGCFHLDWEKYPIFMYIPERWEEQRNKRLRDNPEKFTDAENILVEDIYCDAKSVADDCDPALCMFSNATMKNVVVRGIHCIDDRRLADFFNANTLSELKISKE